MHIINYSLLLMHNIHYPLFLMHITQAPALQGEGGSCPRRRWLPACAEERRLEINVPNCLTLCQNLVANAEEMRRRPEIVFNMNLFSSGPEEVFVLCQI